MPMTAKDGRRRDARVSRSLTICANMLRRPGTASPVDDSRRRKSVMLQYTEIDHALPAGFGVRPLANESLPDDRSDYSQQLLPDERRRTIELPYLDLHPSFLHL